MNLQLLKEHIEGIDIYILDLILKGQYQPGSRILDAGCGNGRNLKWFYAENFEIHGIDTNLKSLQTCKEIYKHQHTNFMKASVENIPYKSNSFDHLICNAVMHFSNDLEHFYKMFEELIRVLKSQGVLFIRIASNFGIENQVKHIANGVYKLPDGSTRFLLTQKILDEMLNTKGISLNENVKTTIVHNRRSMTTLIIKKE